MNGTSSGVTVPDDRELKLFQRLVLERLGIHLPDQKRTLISNRLWKRLQARGVNRFRDYYDLINRRDEQDELNLALELITTNETYFFREPRHFDYLKDQILPSLRDRSEVRIWSAACSSGEEIYSIAMVLSEQRGNNWELLGSDVNLSMLERARLGIYLDQRTDQIPESYRRRFCRRGIGPHEGRLRIVPELRSRIRLQQIRLHEPLPDVGIFDVIFLRNVMIYFDERTRARVVQQVAAHLAPGGYLFVGHAESLHGIGSQLAPVQPAIYRNRIARHERRAS